MYAEKIKFVNCTYSFFENILIYLFNVFWYYISIIKNLYESEYNIINNDIN